MLSIKMASELRHYARDRAVVDHNCQSDALYAELLPRFMLDISRVYRYLAKGFGLPGG
jgi:hypothetical protein